MRHKISVFDQQVMNEHRAVIQAFSNSLEVAKRIAQDALALIIRREALAGDWQYDPAAGELVSVDPAQAVVPQLATPTEAVVPTVALKPLPGSEIPEQPKANGSAARRHGPTDEIQ